MKASFVIPSRDCHTWLPHAVRSVLDQSYKDWELVIVNDGSADKTAQYLAWLEAKKDPRIVIFNTSGLGRSKARNLGNIAATGDLILVLDADDIATPNRAAMTVKKYRDTGARFICGGATMIDALGRDLGIMATGPVSRQKSLDTKLNGIVHSTVAYTKEFSKEYEYADGEFSELGLDDWHQQIRAILNGVMMAYIPTQLCAYRQLDSAISKVRDEAKVLAIKERAICALLPQLEPAKT